MKYLRFSLLAILTTFCLQITQAISIKHGPYLQNVFQNEATVVWISSKPSVGWVELAPDDGSHYYGQERQKFFDTRVGVKVTSTLHSVRITGLKPGTTYRYRIYSQEVVNHTGVFIQYGPVAATDVFRHEPLKFKTLDVNKDETSFVVMNDVHGRSDILSPMLNNADYKNKDLIFFNGDMVSIVKSEQDFFDGFMTECTNIFAKEKSPYYVRGNHETRGVFATEFQKYFSPKQPNLYFTMRQGPVFFIILDTGEDKPDDDIEYSGITDYDTYRSQQAEWLKTVKDDPLFQSAKFRVVIGHIPTTNGKRIWHGDVECLSKFTPILNEMDIDVMLGGHTHTDSYHEPNEVVKYPVLVNSNKGCLDAVVKNGILTIKTINLEGKTIGTKTFKCKR